MKREPVVIKISGSFIQPEKLDMIKRYAEILLHAWERKSIRPIVVVGGGNVARHYIKCCRELGASEAILDLIGIEVTRVNARLLITALKEGAIPHPPKTVEELVEALQDPTERIVVMGGLQPGQSTNAVSVIAAEVAGASKIINATRVDGVYDKDPERYADAKLIPQITLEELKRLVEGEESIAGEYKLLDLTAFSLLKRSRITLYIINGRDPENILRIISGEKIGTEVVP